MNKPSKDYISFICRLYGDRYDDQEEDSSPGGLDWEPGKRAAHKSLNAFQKELREEGIRLSRSKIQKILVTGNRWSTERSREVQRLYEEEAEKGTVYGLEEKSSNARRIERWRRKILLHNDQ